MHKKRFRCYAISRGRMAFKTNYPNCRQFWQNQARSQVSSLGGMMFVFIIGLQQIFLSTTKFGRHKRIWWLLPRMTPVCAGIGRTVARKSSIGALLFVKGTRHPENVYVIHNMNRICRLFKLIINIFPQIPIIGSFQLKILNELNIGILVVKSLPFN